MVSLTIGLLVLCVCGPLLKPIDAAPIQEDDENNGRSFKREFELFQNEIQDEWELDDNEYLSRRELEEAYDREEKMLKNSHNDIPKNNDISKNKDISKNNDVPKNNNNDSPKKNDMSKNNEEEKRWLDIDTPKNGASEQQKSHAFDDALPKNGELFQEDIVMDDYVRDMFNGEAEKRDAVSLASYHWRDRTLHYEFDEDIAPRSKGVIERAIQEYHKHTCVRFKKKRFGDGVPDYIRFISNGSSCYSNVGRRGGRQDVSIGFGCLRLGTPIHEIMHVLGFFHEMARPDRDESVDIHWENIKDKLKHNFRKIPKSMDTKLIPYNFDSVMEYSNDAFSKNGGHTITARYDPTRRFGQRQAFSVGDIKEINILFGCPEYNRKFEDVDISSLVYPY